MKILATLANCGWLVFAVIMTVKEPVDAFAILAVILIFATLILNSVAMFWRGETHNWLSLFLQRKALEEKTKMEALRGKSSDKSAA